MAVLAILFSFACFALWFSRNLKKHPSLPPGPPAEPLIGHLRLIPPNNPETLFYELGKTYGTYLLNVLLSLVLTSMILGDVVHLQLLGRSIIVLNSVQAAIDLLDKRGANYSDRPAFPLLR